MAPARPVWAGEQGPTLRPAAVALAQGLGPVWIPSRLGGVCKLSVCMGKYCDEDESFFGRKKKVYLWCCRVSDKLTFLKDVFVHFEKMLKI